MLHVVVVFGFVRSSLRFHVPVKLKANWASTAFTQVPRFEMPSRYDTCKLLISGVVGTDPKEIYLKSGHYVVNFAVSIVYSPLAHSVSQIITLLVLQLAVVGHFRPIHQQEQLKAAETMWLSMEMWDDLAKKNYANIKKGRPVRGVGYVIQNKWTDKDTGEERKMYKVRITKMMAAEEFDKVSELLQDVDDSRNSGEPLSDVSDTGFSSSFPTNDDQTDEFDDLPRDSANTMHRTQVESNGGYTYRKVSSSGMHLTTHQQPPQQQHRAHQSPPVRNTQPPPVESVEFSENMPAPGAGGDGKKVWANLQNAYPGMVKPMQRVITPMSREPKYPEWK